MKEIIKRKTNGIALLNTTAIIYCFKLEEVQIETIATGLNFQDNKAHCHTFETLLSREYVQDHGGVAYLPITNQVLQFWEIKNQ